MITKSQIDQLIKSTVENINQFKINNLKDVFVIEHIDLHQSSITVQGIRH